MAADKNIAKKATANANKKFGSQRHNVRRKVVSMRRKGNSWAAIANELDIAPRTARRLFDEGVKAKGAHHEELQFGLIPGKGGRRTAEMQAAAAAAGVTGLEIQDEEA